MAAIASTMNSTLEEALQPDGGSLNPDEQDKILTSIGSTQRSLKVNYTKEGTVVNDPHAQPTQGKELFCITRC